MITFSIYINGVEARNLFLISAPVCCGERMQFSLMLTKDTEINNIDIVFPLTDFTGEALIFNNGFCTNDFVNVQKLNGRLISRDIVMIKEGERCFSIGMTSAETFLTRFITEPGKLILRHYFEGKVYPKGSYPLEEFVISDELCGGEFFGRYCDYLKEKFNIVLPSVPDAGWSSWSCLYGLVTENDVLKQSEQLKQFEGADLIQIDDGWQNGGTFCSDWTNSKTAFGMGMEALSQKLKENGQRLGLWLAPTMVSNNQEFFKTHYDFNIIYDDGSITRSFGGNQVLCADNDGSVFPLDLENEDVLQHIEGSFKNAVENYDCHYFKIDFLVRSLIRNVEGNNLNDVYYHDQPSVRVYKNAINCIRRAVGKDTFLMACGAPITEAIGVFDAIRTAPDITWCSSGPENRIFTYWQIVEKDIQNVFLRSYYNGKVFLVDADALIVRDKIGVRYDDFTPTLEEARTWATTVALSGGAVLINEEIEKLPQERLQLIKQVICPIGIAAYPEDFFEYPSVSRVSLITNGKRIAAKFNWKNEEAVDCIFNHRTALVFDCWSKEFLGCYTGDITVTVPPHGVRALLIIEKPDTDALLASTENFFMGIDKPLKPEKGTYRYVKATDTVELI